MRPWTHSIFAEMSELAARTGAVNLGQGSPDGGAPSELVEAAVAAMRAGHHQYPPGPGLASLRSAVADHQARHYGLDVDPVEGVVVTMGASEALVAAVLAFCEPGDEVLTFEPWFDLYGAAIALAGAVRRTVALRPDPSGGRYTFDHDELRAAVTPRTRLLLLNTPHNPTGKVFDELELAEVARVCREAGLLAVTDEVYEHLTFDGRPHIPLAALPGMAERTVTVSSAGKTFSVTGWKVGWASGPPQLIGAVRAVKQHLTYSGGTPFQHAIAAVLGDDDRLVAGLRSTLQGRRDRLCEGLDRAGFTVHRPEGTYFVTADAAPVGATDGRSFCLELPERAGVVAVPNEVFYDDPATGRTLVRFACCQRDEVVHEAVRRLVAAFG
jgi:N-succinyldiaminopimelate aminotransferase